MPRPWIPEQLFIVHSISKSAGNDKLAETILQIFEPSCAFAAGLALAFGSSGAQAQSENDANTYLNRAAHSPPDLRLPLGAVAHRRNPKMTPTR
jgi:hypothetical protein